MHEPEFNNMVQCDYCDKYKTHRQMHPGSKVCLDCCEAAYLQSEIEREEDKALAEYKEHIKWVKRGG